MHYLDAILACITLALLAIAVISLFVNARLSGTTVEQLFRASAVVMYQYPRTVLIYIFGCIAYIVIGAASLYFGMHYFGLAMLVVAAAASYNTAYFYSLHRQIARGIRIL